MQFKDFMAQQDTPTKKPSAKKKAKKSNRSFIWLSSAIAVAAAFLAIQLFSIEFTILFALMLAGGSWAFYQHQTHEKTHRLFTRHLNNIIKNHDRLVREVARNRNDIADIKEGISDTVKTFDTPAENDNRAQKTDHVHAILQKLGTLSQKQRPDADSASAGKEILALRTKQAPAAKPKADKYADAAMSNDEFSDTVVLELIHSALEKDRFNIFVQPIVRLPQRKPVFYEIYGRLVARPGTYLSADRYMKLAQEESVVPAIDNVMLLRILQMLRETGNDHEDAPPYFLNISGRTLQDANYMGDLLTFLERSHKLARRLVFEMPQRDFKNLSARSRAVLTAMGKLGCRLSVDSVQSRDINMKQLFDNRASFIKLDAKSIMDEASTRDGIVRMRELKRDLEEAGVELIVEKIEHERDLREILDYNVDYGQGFLFGAPELYGRFAREKIWQAA